MRENCPNCGTRLLTHDAFCSECRCPLDEPVYLHEPETPSVGKRGPASQISDLFTVTGRLVVIATILLAAGGTFAVIAYFADTLPSGRYPLLVFGAPVWFASGLLFFVMAGLLTRLGIKVFRDPK